MTVVPVPGFGAANLEPETNFGAWLDRLLLNGHLWAQSKTWDPEGVLSTLPAIATCVLGMLSGRLITSVRYALEKVAWLFFIGAALIVSGLAWSLLFPINKALWTSSYVLYSGGIAMQFLAAIYWFIDVLGFKKWTTPFVYYGTNAPFCFCCFGHASKNLVTHKSGCQRNDILMVISVSKSICFLVSSKKCFVTICLNAISLIFDNTLANAQKENSY